MTATCLQDNEFSVNKSVFANGKSILLNHPELEYPISLLRIDELHPSAAARILTRRQPPAGSHPGAGCDDATFSILGAYVQGEFKWHDRLTVTAGSRLSRIGADIGRFKDPATGLPASFSDNWTSSVNAARASYSLNPEDSRRLWAGVSQSFRAPNIADLSRFGKSRSNETEVAATNLALKNS